MTFPTWEKFEELLYSLSKQPGYKPKKGERKNGSALITPAVYEKGTTRANRNVLSWNGWVALDIDEYEGSFEEAIKTFERNRFVCYSSASSSKEKPKFRIVFPLTKHIEADKIKHLWFALNQEFNSLGDPQTKDLSRMYYCLLIAFAAIDTIIEYIFEYQPVLSIVRYSIISLLLTNGQS